MDPEETSEKLASWIRQQVSAAGSSGAVFGMSGGIDSAVTAVLCRRAFPDNCLGVIMPCRSDPRDAEHASLVADRFGIPTRLVPLDSVNDALLNVPTKTPSRPAGRAPPRATAASGCGW